jgi:hypothetical protein
MTIVAEAFEQLSGTCPGQVRDIERKYERKRKREQRKNLKKDNQMAEANDAASRAVSVRDTGAARCEIIGGNKFLTEEVASDGSKKEATTRARGTRLSQTAALSDTDRQFAINHGVPSPDAAWAEFRDYWIGVPGQRGTKLDWSATWRNRIRQISARHGNYIRGPSPAKRTNFDAALEWIADDNGKTGENSDCCDVKRLPAASGQS